MISTYLPGYAGSCMGFILTFIRWILRRFAGALLIVVLSLAAGGLWLFLKDSVDFDAWREGAVRVLSGQREQTRQALADVRGRMDRISAEIHAEEERGRVADGAIAKLQELESMWDRLVGNPEQQKANAQQIDKLRETRRQVREKVEALKRDFTRTTWERDGLELALGKVEAQIAEAEARQSRVLHYLEEAWNHPLGPNPLQLPVKVWVVTFLIGYLAGPTLLRLFLYFVVAPRLAAGRPVRLADSLAARPEVGESRAAVELPLTPGDRLWVREKFLQASDEGLSRRTRMVLDWRIPFTCLASGLVELIEMRVGAAGPEQRVTLSNQGDAHRELAIVHLPAGARLVLRPSFLAGVVLGAGDRLRLRRRWQFLRWQAWITLQFRFFEFEGPCRLVVAGTRGVRVEDLSQRPEGVVPARRANQDAVMGFTPDLDYRPARAETFWSYYRGMNPLFDDLFAGRGLFLCQQVSSDGDAGRARRFWAGTWGLATRMFGL